MTEENNYNVGIVENGDEFQISSDEQILSKDEALELTESIKTTATATCILLKKAHDEQAWKALGYSSWTKYIEGEFDFTRVRSYQLISQGEVIQELSEASDTELYLTEKEAKIIKKELPKITKKLKEETEDLEDESERKDKAKEILDEEIQHALFTDKDTYDESRDIEDMISEDGGGEDEGGYSGGGNGGGYDNQSDKVVFTPTDDDEEDKNTSYSSGQDYSFYYNYMLKMIDIIEEFPNPSELSNEFRNLEEEERIKLRNKMKYGSSWLNKMAENV